MATKVNILKKAPRYSAVLLLLLTAAFAFASLGDGKSRATNSPAAKKALLSNKAVANSGSFSLKSGYTFRGTKVFNNDAENRFIRLNTTVTLQKGNTTYTIPLKKKVILENVKLEIGNRQFHRN